MLHNLSATHTSHLKMEMMRIWFSLWLLERLKKVAPKKGLVTEPDLVPCLPQMAQSWRPSSLDPAYEVSLLNSSPHCFVLISSCSALCFFTSHFEIVIIFPVPFSFYPMVTYDLHSRLQAPWHRSYLCYCHSPGRMWVT